VTVSAWLPDAPPPPSEFEQRNAAAADKGLAGGLAGLLVWSRAGGTLERHAGVFYLTDFATSFPTVGDVLSRWSDRGYTACLVLPGPRTILLVDVPGVSPADVYADEIIQVDDLVAEVATVVRKTGLASSRLGIVGRDLLTANLDGRLRRLLPAADFVDAGGILESLRAIKSPFEQGQLRHSASVGLEAVTAALKKVEPARTAGEIVAHAAHAAIARGGLVYNMFADFYGSTREHRRNWFPPYEDAQPAASGDMFCLDMTGAVRGYMWDLSRSTGVGRAQPQHQVMLDLAREAVEAVIEQLVPGNTVGRAAGAGMNVLLAAGQPRGGGRREFNALGHGIGLGFEPPWLFEDDPTELVAGMALCVERACVDGPHGAVYEEMVLIHETGPEVITRR
jgi:Xaa-Pro aminopeptidase